MEPGRVGSGLGSMFFMSRPASWSGYRQNKKTDFCPEHLLQSCQTSDGFAAVLWNRIT